MRDCWNLLSAGLTPDTRRKDFPLDTGPELLCIFGATEPCFIQSYAVGIGFVIAAIGSIVDAIAIKSATANHPLTAVGIFGQFGGIAAV
jgi:hypothetical protein